MSDLISRSALIKDLKQKCAGNCKKCEYSTFLSSDEHCSVIDEQPAVEAKPVVHGEFTLAFTETENVWKCSVCDKYWLLNDGTPFDNEMNFCPRCGADMRK